jgi:excinuclease ABC subunit A
MEKAQIDHIQIRSARVNNLKNIDLDIPLRKLICFAGPSGSGKTSIAFHTLLTESKRRFVNSFPNSLKFFTERPAAVDVDSIFPVLPVFGLPQINPVVGSRTVVSDVMRLTDGLQNLFFTASTELCPIHDLELKIKNVSDQIKEQIPNLLTDEVYHILLNPNEFQRVFGDSFFPARSYSSKKKNIENFDEQDDLWEVLRFKGSNISTLQNKWSELRLDQYQLNYFVFSKSLKKPLKLKFHFEKVCPECDFDSKPVFSVSAFSPYSALGACPHCNGYGANLIYDEKKLIDKELSIQEGGLRLLNYGPFQFAFEELLKILKRKKIPTDVPIKKLPKDFFDLLNDGSGQYPGFTELKDYLESKKYKPSVRIYIRNLQKEEPCTFCHSTRLNPKIHHYRLHQNESKNSLAEIMQLSVCEALELFKKLHWNKRSHEERLRDDIFEKLQLAYDMGLGHLSLLRKAKSLSAGEYQRLLLIKYLTFKGTDSLFVLDEPSTGLGENELKKLLASMRQIVDQGNTVILIDHSEFIQKNVDHLIVMGPGSGKNGGEVLFKGSSALYLKQKNKINWDVKKDFQITKKFAEITSPEIFGKKYPDYKIPLNELVWVTGISGTGKTANIIKVFANSLYKKIHGEWLDDQEFSVKSIKTPFNFEDIIIVSSDLNRFTSRSSVGTITEFSSVIRKHFLKLPISKSMKLKDGHLSANSDLGMCLRCEGKGIIVIEMQYLEDIVLECEDCKGLKIRPLYANISDGKMTVAEAYNLPLNQVLERVELTPKYQRIWEYIKILNLDYLSLDRSLNSLSGGEKQRIYLLSKLVKTIENSLIIFENLSFGLSELELKQLGLFLHGLLKLNNSILVIDSSPAFRHLATSELHFSEGTITVKSLK